MKHASDVPPVRAGWRDRLFGKPHGKGLWAWIFLGVLALSTLVIARPGVRGLLRDIGVAARSEGCAIAQDIGRMLRGQPTDWSKVEGDCARDPASGT